jgi:tetratricopeptide (TPR) repeat protein
MSDRADRAYLQVCIAQRAAEAGDPARAAAVAGRIALPIYHAQALLHAARAYITAGNRPAAKAALAEARTLANSTTGTGRRGEFDIELVAVCADAGAFDSATTIAAAIPTPYVRAAAVGKIAAAHCRTGDYQRALAAIGANKNPLETIPAYSEVATMQAAAGHLRAAIDTSAHIPLGVARGDSLRAIFKSAAIKVTVEELARTAAHFRTPDERAHACLGIAEGLLARDNPAPSQSPATRPSVPQ